MRIKCPHCNGKGFSELNSAVNMTCGWCMGQGELDLEIIPTESQTKQEYLQTCTTEQLAEFLFRIAYMCSYCGDEAHSSQEKMQQCHFGKCECRRKDWEMWLKQPHIPKE